MISTNIPSGTVVQININTKTLESVKANCEDLRVVYQNSTDVPRCYSLASGTVNCNTSNSTTVTFQIQSNASSSDSANYSLYFGNAGATSPAYTGVSTHNAGSKSAVIVCPFAESTTCLDNRTPTTASGAICFSGSKSAINFDGADDYIVTTGNDTNLNF